MVAASHSSDAFTAADAALSFLLVRDAPSALEVLLDAPDASAVVVERALALAGSHAAELDVDGFAALADGVLALLWGADPEQTVDAVVRLCTMALQLGRADLCARFLGSITGALRCLTIRGDAQRLQRVAALSSAALSLAQDRGPPAAA